MTRVILHAGMHKTGSSFLQNTLQGNRDRLLAGGILYPEAGLHRDSPQAGYRHLGLRRSLAQEGSGSFAVERLHQEVAERGCPVVVLSYEGFFTPETDVGELRAALTGYDVTVLVFLRHPVDYLESKYREWVRLLRETSDIETYLSRQWPFLEVLRRADEWGERFGRDNLVFRSYDDLVVPDGIVSHVLELAGRPDLVLEPSSQSNPSATNEYTLVKLLANRMGLAGERIGNDVVASLDVDYGGNGGRLLSRAAVDRVQAIALPEFVGLLERSGQRPLLASRFAELERDDRFFEPEVRASIMRQLHEAQALSAAEADRIARERHEAKVLARRTRRDLATTTRQLERSKDKSHRLEGTLREVRADLHEHQARLRQSEELRAEMEQRLDQVTSRLDIVQARLQRAHAERADLRHRLELAKFWRPRNWIRYVAGVRSRL